MADIGVGPSKLVVRNTFIELGDEEPIREINRRSSAPEVYGVIGGSTAPTQDREQAGGQSPAFIREVSPPPGMPVPNVGVQGMQSEGLSSFGTQSEGLVPEAGVDSAKDRLHISGIGRREPATVVVKNTFIDVNQESDDSFGEEGTQMRMGRHQSDTTVKYSGGLPLTSPKAKAKSGRTPKGRQTPGSRNKRNSLRGYNFYDGGDDMMYDRRGSVMSIMTNESPMAKHDHQFGYGGDRYGRVGMDAGSRAVPAAMHPFGGMPPPFGPPPRGPMPGESYPPWWFMPPYMPGMNPYMPPQPPFMPPVPGYPGMQPPSFDQSCGKGGKSGSGKGKGGGKSGGHTRSTIMMRNLPGEYTRDMVIELLDKEGFSGLYDFVYMPMNLRTKESFGYVFVDLVSPVVADQCRSRFQGFTQWSVDSPKACDVLWSDEQQGLSANIERYRNSPVMHESVPEDCKPVVFANGMRMQFPHPTKRLREPRIRRAAPGTEKSGGPQQQEA